MNAPCLAAPLRARLRAARCWLRSGLGLVALLLGGCASAPPVVPPALPTVNAWQACQLYCAPYPVAFAQMDAAWHLGCACAIPAKRFEEPKPESWRLEEFRSRPEVLGLPAAVAACRRRRA